MLTTTAERDTHEVILTVIAHLIVVALDEDRGPLDDRLAVHYPWIKLPNATEQRQCAKDIIDTVRAAFVVDEPLHIVAKKQTRQPCPSTNQKRRIHPALCQLRSNRWLAESQRNQDERTSGRAGRSHRKPHPKRRKGLELRGGRPEPSPKNHIFKVIR
ncbi:hypothetical protein GCM10022198_14970 [Klugiella xanthotipulae]